MDLDSILLGLHINIYILIVQFCAWLQVVDKIGYKITEVQKKCKFPKAPGAMNFEGKCLHLHQVPNSQYVVDVITNEDLDTRNKNHIWSGDFCRNMCNFMAGQL